MTPSPTPSPADIFGSLPVARYQVRIQLSRPISGYMGSAWRGLIGWELKRLVCPFARKPDCKSCIIREHCPYFRLFEDQSPASGLQEMPRGYILSPTGSSGSRAHQLDITLIGNCIRSFPAIVQAIDSGKTTGLGPSRVRYDIVGINWISSNGRMTPFSLDTGDGIGMSGSAPLKDWLGATPVITGQTEVRLLTPIRLRKQGKYMGQMEWPYFFATLIRRLESLNTLFSDGEPLGRERYQSLVHRFSNVAVTRENLSWMDYNRYSNRQNKKVPMGGLVGAIAFSESNAWLVPWFQAAGLVHVGKGASMGLGKISILPHGHGGDENEADGRERTSVILNLKRNASGIQESEFG